MTPAVDPAEEPRAPSRVYAGEAFLELWRETLTVRHALPYGVVLAQRDDTDAHRAEAADQGYRGADAVWRSLVEHELLHVIAPPLLFRRGSWVLQHEAGACRARYALRLHEEACLLSFQYWRNTGDCDPVLSAFEPSTLQAINGELDHVVPW
jgi:hypothetical protein